MRYKQRMHGHALRAERRRRRLTADDVAIALGRTPIQIRRLETGRTRITVADLAQIRRAWGTAAMLRIVGE